MAEDNTDIPEATETPEPSQPDTPATRIMTKGSLLVVLASLLIAFVLVLAMGPSPQPTAVEQPHVDVEQHTAVMNPDGDLDRYTVITFDACRHGDISMNDVTTLANITDRVTIDHRRSTSAINGPSPQVTTFVDYLPTDQARELGRVLDEVIVAFGICA